MTPRSESKVIECSHFMEGRKAFDREGEQRVSDYPGRRSSHIDVKKRYRPENMKKVPSQSHSDREQQIHCGLGPNVSWNEGSRTPDEALPAPFSLRLHFRLLLTFQYKFRSSTKTGTYPELAVVVLEPLVAFFWETKDHLHDTKSQRLSPWVSTLSLWPKRSHTWKKDQSRSSCPHGSAARTALALLFGTIIDIVLTSFTSHGRVASITSKKAHAPETLFCWWCLHPLTWAEGTQHPANTANVNVWSALGLAHSLLVISIRLSSRSSQCYEDEQKVGWTDRSCAESQGASGASKATLLSLLSGKRMAPAATVNVGGAVLKNHCILRKQSSSCATHRVSKVVRFHTDDVGEIEVSYQALGQIKCRKSEHIRHHSGIVFRHLFFASILAQITSQNLRSAGDYPDRNEKTFASDSALAEPVCYIFTRWAGTDWEMCINPRVEDIKFSQGRLEIVLLGVAWRLRSSVKIQDLAQMLDRIDDKINRSLVASVGFDENRCQDLRSGDTPPPVLPWYASVLHAGRPAKLSIRRSFRSDLLAGLDKTRVAESPAVDGE
nr:hypothetical protein CFP56_19650 [Quercus suber]